MDFLVDGNLHILKVCHLLLLAKKPIAKIGSMEKELS
jgi:hypothetical protein